MNKEERRIFLEKNREFNRFWHEMDDAERERILNEFREAMSKHGPRIKEGLKLFHNVIEKVRVKYEEVAEFYKSHFGKEPLGWDRFLIWFLGEKHKRETFSDMTTYPPGVSVEDVIEAVEWEITKVKERLALPSQEISNKKRDDELNLNSTLQELFQFTPDFNRAMEVIEAPLPDESIAVKGGNWVYEGKSDKALIVAFADSIRETLSIPSSTSSNKVAQLIATYFGIEWKKKSHRARWKGGLKKNGLAYDYSEFRKHFLAKL